MNHIVVEIQRLSLGTNAGFFSLDNKLCLSELEGEKRNLLGGDVATKDPCCLVGCG